MQVNIFRWIDGDTFTATISDNPLRVVPVRVAGAWAPERGDHGFAECIWFAIQHAPPGPYPVVDLLSEKDRFGRVLLDFRLRDGRLYSDAVNEWVRSNGFDWGKGTVSYAYTALRDQRRAN